MDNDNPTWIDEKLLESVLQVNPEEPVEILRFITEPAVGPGKNYTSYIYRVRVDYKYKASLQSQSITLIVKKPFETGFVAEMSGCANIQDKEQVMYQVLLPGMSKKTNFEFGPKTFISPLGNIVVMEDLKEQGYIMSETKNQLDYPHCKMVCEALAKFHASSVSCFHDEPELVSEHLGIDGLWGDGSVMERWMMNAIKYTVTVIKEMNLEKRFKEFFLRRADHIWNSITVSVKPKPKGFNVLNHGDLWENNLLFRYDESNNVTGLKFLDFQNTKYASPVVDLIYFIWTSASDEVRNKNQKDLYEVYVKELNSTLEQLGCRERLSLEELWEDLREYKDWGLYVLCFCLPLQLSAPEDTIDLSTFSAEDFTGDKFKQLFDGEYYRSCLPSFTKQFSEFFL